MKLFSKKQNENRSIVRICWSILSVTGLLYLSSRLPIFKSKIKYSLSETGQANIRVWSLKDSEKEEQFIPKNILGHYLIWLYLVFENILYTRALKTDNVNEIRNENEKGM